jgi:predicted RNA-binding protein
MVSIIRTQDGAGLLKDPKVTGIFISNAEDDYSVSRIFLIKHESSKEIGC